MSITDELFIDAPPERVWKLTLDLESWPETTPTMTSVERLDTGPLRVGSRARVKQPGQPSRVWTVTQLEPGSLFAWEAKSPGVRMTGSHRVEPASGGCRNTLGFQLRGPMAGVATALLGRALRRAIATENEGFRRAAEAASR